MALPEQRHHRPPGSLRVGKAMKDHDRVAAFPPFGPMQFDPFYDLPKGRGSVRGKRAMGALLSVQHNSTCASKFRPHRSLAAAGVAVVLCGANVARRTSAGAEPHRSDAAQRLETGNHVEQFLIDAALS